MGLGGLIGRRSAWPAMLLHLLRHFNATTPLKVQGVR
jgi:hypothetical protein